MKKKLIAILTILSLVILIPSTAFASIVGTGPVDEYGIPAGAVGLSLSGENAVDANQDYVNFVNYLDESCESNGTCFKGGVGVVLRVFKYEGGSEEPIGNPLYIINESMLVDLVTNNGAAIPGSYSSFVSKNWGFTQYMAPSDLSNKTWIINGVPEKGEEGNPNLATKDYTVSGPEDTELEGEEITYRDRFSFQFDLSHCTYISKRGKMKSKSEAPIGFKTGFVHKIYKYKTPYKKTTYPKSKINNMPSSYIDDPNLTEANVASGYLNTHIEKQYVYVSINKINELYGTSLKDTDIGKYYIELQGVYRQLLPPEYVGTFLVKTLDNKVSEENELTEEDVYLYDYTPTDEDECPGDNWKGDVLVAHKDAYCSRNKTKPTVSYTCSVSGTSCNSTTYCTYHAEQAEIKGDAYCHTTVPRYKYDYEGCGVKHFHQLYGDSYVGESMLVTTKGDTDIKCDSSSTGSIANMITDDNNRHCIIADDDQNYSRKEEDNTCTTGFEYYIGPNQEEALVGTTDAAKYNMFVGSAKDVPVGNKCRTGVKHFYVMDVTTDLCTDVCSAVSSDTRSDAYLKCAENFCENDVDYNLGGNPYLRKQSCILHSCNFSYGVDPETKANNSNYRQSESSCDNSSLFKNGTEYKKYSVNQNTSCSMYGSNSIDNLQTDLSICYGDTITDYDNNVSNDKRFDERTYINIACQESDKVSSITDISQRVFSPGEPIDFALKVRGTIQCIAFFDYEQWKIDYASIPRKDKIRKNRMKYLFDRFNNLVDSNHITNDSYTKFKALDYKGKTEYNWNMELTDYGTINWSKYQFKTDNITASTTVNEYQLDNSILQTIEDPLVVGAREVTNTKNPIDLHSTGTSYVYTGLKNKKLYSVENYNDVVMDTTGNSTVQAYMITSGTDIAYQFSKYCVDNNAKTIKKATGALCSNGTGGENEYYVNFKAQASQNIVGNNNHNFVTNVSIKSSLPIEQMYTDKTCTTSESRPPSVTFNNQDTCNYNVVRNSVSPKYNCEISCTGNDALGKGNYQGSFTATMYTYEDGVRYNSNYNNLHISSKYTSRDVNSKTTNITMSSGNAGTIEKFTIEGTFTDDNNNRHNCYKTCSILKKVQNEPNCKIIKVSDDLYQIKPEGSYTRIGVTILRDTLSEEDIVDIMPDKNDRYLVEVKNTSYETSLVLSGHIQGPGGSNTCLYTDDVTILDNNCPKKFKPGEYEKIKKYCDVFFLKDVNNYLDPEDCVSKCIPCPDGVEPYEDTEIKIERNINIIKKDYCMRWSENKYASYEACINTTYRMCVTGIPIKTKDPYLYRPVNRNNPFPSSVEAPDGYASGARTIGVNWQGYTNYITDTYVNKGSPDFKITLNTSTINYIKTKVDSLRAAGETNIYAKEKYMNDADPTKKYLSRFIHEDLDGRFCYLNGVEYPDNCK